MDRGINEAVLAHMVIWVGDRYERSHYTTDILFIFVYFQVFP